jgi:hypothetical protein
LVVRFHCFKDAARTRGLVNRRAEISAPGMDGLRQLDEVEAHLFGDAFEQTIPEISAEA